jgi:cell division protein FtsB
MDLQLDFTAFLNLLRERAYGWRRRAATVGVAVLACMLAWHVVFGPNGMLTYHQKKGESRTLDLEIESLQRENQKLKGEIEGLKSDPRAIEREAREQLRYARPGEMIYTLPQPPQPAPPANANAQNHP